VGYLQSFCWESQTHFLNCPFWFSELGKSQSEEFHTLGQPYFHRLQQKKQNMPQSFEDISGHVPAPLGETPTSTNVLECMLRHHLRDCPDKKCLTNLVEFAFASDFLLPLCSRKDHPPLLQVLWVPAIALSLFTCHSLSPFTTDAAYTEVRKIKYQEALIHVCCLFLPLTTWITLNSKCLKVKTLHCA